MTDVTQNLARLLIDDTMALVDQLETLEALIKTTPVGAPSVVLTFSPQLAEHVLANRNDSNRPPRTGKINRFAQYLSDDGWLLTGDTLKFSADGRLVDGQNRLRACVLAGVSLRTHVMFGLDYAVFKVLDSGAGRTMGDTFTVAGVAYAGQAARAARWLLIFDETRHKDRGVVVANSDLFDYYRKYIDKTGLTRQIRRAREVDRTLPTGTLAALLYLFERVDAKTNAIFAHDLQHRTRSARHLLDEIDRVRRNSGNRIHENIVVALIIQTWNAYRAGQSIRSGNQLKWVDEKTRPDIK